MIMNLMSNIILSMQKQQLSIYRSQARAAWEQVHIAHDQLIVTLASVVIAAIWLIVYLFSRKVHWHPIIKHETHDKVKNLSISLMNSSGSKANDTIILWRPIYITCTHHISFNIKLFNFYNKLLFSKFAYIHYWIRDHFSNFNMKRYRYILFHCYTKPIGINWFRLHFLRQYQQNNVYRKHLKVENHFLQVIRGSKFQIYGNRNDPKNIFIPMNLIYLTFRYQNNEYMKMIRHRMFFAKRRYMIINKRFKHIINNRPFYPLYMSFLDIKYLKRYRFLLLRRKLFYTKYHSLRELQHLTKREIVATKNNKYFPVFHRVLHYILIPCYDMKSHDVQIVVIDPRKL